MCKGETGMHSGQMEETPWTITDSQNHIENIAIFPEAENSWSVLHPQHSHNILPLRRNTDSTVPTFFSQQTVCQAKLQGKIKFHLRKCSVMQTDLIVKKK